MAHRHQQQTDEALDLNALRQQLFDTTEACRKCMIAIDHQVLQQCEDTMDKSTESTHQLHQTITELEAQLKAEKEKNFEALTDGQQSRFDALIIQYKKKIQDIEDEKIRVDGDNRKLRMELHDCQRRLKDAEELIAQLTNSRAQTAAYDQDKVQLLEAQLKVYQEDFATEREERKQYQTRIANLEQLLNYLSRQYQMQQRPLSLPGQQLELPQAPVYSRGQSDGGHGQVSTIQTDALDGQRSMETLEPDAGNLSRACENSG